MHIQQKFPLKLILAILGVGLLVMLGLAIAQQNKGQWEPERLVPVSIAPGESREVSTALIHQGIRDIQDSKVSIQLPDALKGLLALSSVTTVDRTGKEKQSVFRLILAAPLGADIGVMGGEGVLVKQNGQRIKHIPPLPIEITVSHVPIPPDPGDAGKATLEGIDSDGDGMRDDIQRYIALTYPNSERTRAALMQNAKTLQSALLDADDENKSVMHSNESADGAACLKAILGDLKMTRMIKQELRAEILNTSERAAAYFRYNDQLGGHSFPLVEGISRCDFDPSSMEN